MKKYIAAFVAITAMLLALVFATISIAQAPKHSPKAAAPTLPAIDAASAAALAPLATQIRQWTAQIDALNENRQAAHKQWRIIEGKALSAAGLDPASYMIEATGKKFVPRQPGTGGAQ